MNSQANRQSAIVSVAGAVGKAALIMLAHPLWALLSQLNVRVSPLFPWSAVVMLVGLWLLLQLLDGRIGPKSSASARKALLKWRPLPDRVSIWSLIAGGLAMISMAMIETHSVQFGVEVTSNDGLAGAFFALPLFTGITFMIVSSLVAALVEESAFRGYMQSDLEQRFGMPFTITVVAATFGAFHLYGRTMHQWSLGLADWVVISAIFSVMVYLTGSIIPAVVCHFFIDSALYSLDWFDDPLRGLRLQFPGIPVSVGAVVCIATAVASALAFRQLAKIRSRECEVIA